MLIQCVNSLILNLDSQPLSTCKHQNRWCLCWNNKSFMTDATMHKYCQNQGCMTFYASISWKLRANAIAYINLMEIVGRMPHFPQILWKLGGRIRDSWAKIEDECHFYAKLLKGETDEKHDFVNKYGAIPTPLRKLTWPLAAPPVTSSAWPPTNLLCVTSRCGGILCRLCWEIIDWVLCFVGKYCVQIVVVLYFVFIFFVLCYFLYFWFVIFFLFYYFIFYYLYIFDLFVLFFLYFLYFIFYFLYFTSHWDVTWPSSPQAI